MHQAICIAEDGHTTEAALAAISRSLGRTDNVALTEDNRDDDSNARSLRHSAAIALNIASVINRDLNECSFKTFLEY